MTNEKVLHVRQIRSAIGNKPKSRGTLRALGLRKISLSLINNITMINCQAGRPYCCGRIFSWLICNERDFLYAFCSNLMSNCLYSQLTFMLLAASHSDDAIEQYFKSYVCVSCNCKTNSERTRVIIGAIAKILKHVFAF